MNDPLISYLQRFRSIGLEDTALILNAFENRDYKEGDSLLISGHRCTEMFFIHNGVLKIKVQNEKGNEVTHFFLKENQFCTILKSFDKGTVAEESIQAACNAHVSVIKKPQLDLLYQQVPYLKSLIDKIISQGLLDKVNMRNTYLGHDAATRYRLFLLHQPEIASRVPLSDVASYLGITQQSLSRIRKNSY